MLCVCGCVYVMMDLCMWSEDVSVSNSKHIYFLPTQNTSPNHSIQWQCNWQSTHDDTKQIDSRRLADGLVKTEL